MLNILYIVETYNIEPSTLHSCFLWLLHVHPVFVCNGFWHMVQDASNTTVCLWDREAAAKTFLNLSKFRASLCQKYTFQAFLIWMPPPVLFWTFSTAAEKINRRVVWNAKLKKKRKKKKKEVVITAANVRQNAMRKCAVKHVILETI